MDINISIIIVSLLVAISILIYNPAKTYGVPAALIFILSGFFVGNGQSLPAFDFPNSTEIISQFAVGIIIFSGGLHSKLKDIKPVIKEGLILSNFGVLLSSLGFGYIASLITPLNLIEGMLLGSVIASTDAATTFSIIESKQLKLKHQTDKTLEFESATNDPIALILTLLFVQILSGTEAPTLGDSVIFFLKQIGVGIVVSLPIALLISFIIKRINFVVISLKPIFFLAVLLCITLLTGYLGGNSLVSAYILGLVIGNNEFQSKSVSTNFFESFSWLAQAVMFVLLGLQIKPDQLIQLLPIALVLGAILFILIRPASTLLCYLPMRKPLSKQLFVGWMGIKGATPIVFALIPLIDNIPKSEMIFNMTVVIVLMSMIIHGLSFKWSAEKTGIIVDDTPKNSL